jgi:hypothetical protein
MLYSLELLRDYWVHARNGQIGAVQDFLIDPLDWHIRYMVVDPGNWLVERQVLLSTRSIARAFPEKRQIDVNLSKEQIRDSPHADVLLQVSQRAEVRVGGSDNPPAQGIEADAGPRGALSPTSVSVAPLDGVHLLSVKETIGYAIHAKDGAAGTLSDFICNDEDWTVHYLVSNMGETPEKETLIPLMLVQGGIHRDRSDVRVGLTREQIRNSPDYDRSNVSPSYDVQVRAYYGRLPRPLEG